MNELQYCEPRPYRVRPCNVRRYPAVRRRSRTRLWTKTRCVITDATDFLFTSRAERIHSEAITDSYVFERFREACTIGADLFTARKPIVPTSIKKKPYFNWKHTPNTSSPVPLLGPFFLSKAPVSGKKNKKTCFNPGRDRDIWRPRAYVLYSKARGQLERSRRRFTFLVTRLRT